MSFGQLEAPPSSMEAEATATRGRRLRMTVMVAVFGLCCVVVEHG